MASHVFHEIYLHITWHTKDDSPILTASVEPLVHGLLTDRCHQTKGVYLHAINGTPTHVHLAMNIEPQVTISEMVGELKGWSAHELRQKEHHAHGRTQARLEMFSFDDDWSELPVA